MDTPPPPRVQQEAMTSAALLPEQSPSGGCCSLTGAEARTSAAGPWRRCSRGDGSHPRTCQPAGEEGVKSKPRRSGLGRCWGCGRGVTRICPLCPGAPEYINSTVSSQTCTRSRTPPRPPPHHFVTGWHCGKGGRGREARSGNRCWVFFPPLPIHRFGWSHGALALGVAMNGWIPARPGTTRSAEASLPQGALFREGTGTLVQAHRGCKPQPQGGQRPVTSLPDSSWVISSL